MLGQHKISNSTARLGDSVKENAKVHEPAGWRGVTPEAVNTELCRKSLRFRFIAQSWDRSSSACDAVEASPRRHTRQPAQLALMVTQSGVTSCCMPDSEAGEELVFSGVFGLASEGSSARQGESVR